MCDTNVDLHTSHTASPRKASEVEFQEVRGSRPARSGAGGSTASAAAVSAHWQEHKIE